MEHSESELQSPLAEDDGGSLAKCDLQRTKTKTEKEKELQKEKQACDNFKKYNRDFKGEVTIHNVQIETKQAFGRELGIDSVDFWANFGVPSDIDKSFVKENRHQILKILQLALKHKLPDPALPAAGGFSHSIIWKVCLERMSFEMAFWIGVTNTLFVVWAFSYMPQHFWLIYLFELMVLFPKKCYKLLESKPRGHLYCFDFCWIVNILWFACIIFLVFHSGHSQRVGRDARKTMFSVAWGLGCGPLLIAVLVTGNALLFHDADNTVQVLIHLFPSLVLYQFRWKNETVHKYWPKLFDLEYVEELDVYSIYWNAGIAYLIWCTIYLMFLLLHGRKLAKDEDTGEPVVDNIFHKNMRDRQAGVAKMVIYVTRFYKTPGERERELDQMRSSHEYGCAECVVYMVLHAIGVYAGLLVSMPCYVWQWFHGGMCAIMCFVAIINASGKYRAYMLRELMSNIPGMKDDPNPSTSMVSLPTNSQASGV